MPIKVIIEKNIGKSVSELILKGKGMCNYAWYVRTSDDKKYLIKQERSDKETSERNDLITEARTI